MTYYRAYIVGRDGRYKDAVDLDCPDDITALESIKQQQLENRYGIELWQQDRLVAKLPAQRAAKSSHPSSSE
jgi:hypothetical protein